MDLSLFRFFAPLLLIPLSIYILGRTDKNDFKNLTATKRKTTLEPEFKENIDSSSPVKRDGGCGSATSY